MSISDRPQPGSWHISKQELDATVAQLVSKVRLDRSHDIPYLAGYNKAGNVIYIDHAMPRGFNYRGKSIPTDRYLILHETVELALENSRYKLPYLHAHQIALRTERDAVIVDGVPWAEYNVFMMKMVKVIGKRPSYPDVPADLDLEPYQGDRDTLRRMRFAHAAIPATSSVHAIN